MRALSVETLTLVVAPILAELFHLTRLQCVLRGPQTGKFVHISGPRSETREDRITWTLHTDRALIGDEFRALKQVLGRSRSRAMSKNQYFAHVLEEKSGKSGHISGPSFKTT